MSERKCCACGRADDGSSDKRDLRPYGPGGADVCAGCVFGEDGRAANSELLAEAERQLGALYEQAPEGSIIIGAKPLLPLAMVRGGES